MKRTLLLLSLFAVPGMLTSCKDEAATPAPDNTSSVAEVIKSAPEPAAEVSQTAVFHPDELGQSYGCYDMERICACDDGYEGKMVDLQKLKVGDLLEDFCYGAYEAGRTDLVLQCLEMGMDPNSGIKYAAWLGRMDIIQSLFDQGADDYYWGLEGAARGGHMDIVQLMLDKGATDYHAGLEGAARGGHMDIVQLMLDKGASNYNAGLYGAARGGHMDIVQLMLDKGATNYDAGLNGAARGGHLDIVQLMLNKGATDYNWGLRGAAWGGHMEIVQLMLSKGATDYDLGLYNAAECGHLDIVQLLLSKGATDYNLGLEGAVYSGHMEIVQLMLEKGANPNAGFYSAAILGRAEIIKILLAQPGIDVNQKKSSGSTALDEAVDKGHIECIELIRAAGGKRGKEL
ncbi:MAG: ankyrin repeat domain-containing protein [Akkermansia sp.]|nr:ankyrin repeat domain-containing protein [Akkermansia sp.]